MANKQNPSAGSQGPGEGEGSGAQEFIELPEHQGVIIDYIPPRGGMRSEVGDIDAEGESDDIQSRDG